MMDTENSQLLLLECLRENSHRTAQVLAHLAQNITLVVRGLGGGGVGQDKLIQSLLDANELLNRLTSSLVGIALQSAGVRSSEGMVEVLFEIVDRSPASSDFNWAIVQTCESMRGI
jgi:hypothetical protein